MLIWRIWQSSGLLLLLLLNLLIDDAGQRSSCCSAALLHGYSSSHSQYKLLPFRDTGLVSHDLQARLKDSLRLIRSAPSGVKFNVWGGKRSPGAPSAGEMETIWSLKPLLKAYKNEYIKLVCSYILSQEGTLSFSNRCGGASTLQPKRAHFRPWGGKRSPPQSNRLDGYLAGRIFENAGEMLTNPEEADQWHDQQGANDEKRGFSAWGGKRGEGFNAWAGKRQAQDDKISPKIKENSTYLEDLDARALYDRFGLSNPRVVRSPFIRDYQTYNTATGREALKSLIKNIEFPAADERNRRSGFKPWAGKRSEEDLHREQASFDANNAKAQNKIVLGNANKVASKKSFSAWGGKRSETTTQI